MLTITGEELDNLLAHTDSAPDAVLYAAPDPETGSLLVGSEAQADLPPGAVVIARGADLATIVGYTPDLATLEAIAPAYHQIYKTIVTNHLGNGTTKDEAASAGPREGVA